MGQKLELTGQRFGRLVAVAEAGHNRHGQYLWEFRCDCGNRTTIVGSRVKLGYTQSCGCLSPHSEIIPGIGLYNRREANEPTYNCWHSMLDRCQNPNHPYWANWGGRGITVCAAWANPQAGFAAFLADMGPKPPGLTLERADNSKGYSADNCRWATMRDQARNRRSFKLTADMLQSILALYDDGVPVGEISRQVGYNSSGMSVVLGTVTALRELGWTPSPAPPPGT